MHRQVVKKLLVVGLVIASISAVSSKGALAAKVSAPGSPTFVMIASKQVRENLNHITVTLEKPVNSGGASVTSMTVQISSSKCVIRGRAKSCTIKNVSATTNQRIKIQVSATNKKGSSKRVGMYFFPARKLWTATGFTPAGTRYPAITSKVQNSRVLTGNSTKWKKFQAINRNSVSSASIIKQAVPRVGNPTVVFNITGTVGIALPDSLSSAPTSGMFAVRSDGTTVDSLMPGSLAASVRDFYSAPNGRFYVAFTTRTALEQGGALCALAEVNASTGVTTCVDSTIENVALTIFNSQSTPIQFDGQGNIYYTGMANSKFVLRKSVNGVVTDIINDNITLGEFIVLTDGTVIIKGTTSSSFTPWLRRLSLTGRLSNLINQGIQTTFLSRFPDGNIYFGMRDSSNPNSSLSDSIRQYFPSTDYIHAQEWLGRQSSWSTPTARFLLPQCNMSNFTNPPVCSSPSSISKTLSTTDGRVFGVVNLGLGASSNDLVMLYPTPEIINTVIKKVSVVYQVGTKLVLAGTNAAGTNMMTVFEPSTYQETVIIDASNETEVYSVAYVPQTGKLLFNGLKFSNNSLVVGEVDLP